MVIVVFAFLSTFLSTSFAQVDVLEFTQKKDVGSEQVVYFDVVGISDQEMANEILEVLLNDENIRKGRYFISSQGRDRYQLYVKYNLSPDYILSFLQSFNVDFDYCTVSRNGYVEPDNTKFDSNNINTQRTSINYPGFPIFKDTGNPLEDEKRYCEEKDKWVLEHPEEYKQTLIKVTPHE
jgi:hypothetical protein